jgi:hypothetical protein
VDANPLFESGPKADGKPTIDEEVVNGLGALLAKGAKITIGSTSFYIC